MVQVTGTITNTKHTVGIILNNLVCITVIELIITIVKTSTIPPVCMHTDTMNGILITRVGRGGAEEGQGGDPVGGAGREGGAGIGEGDSLKT